jgi:hypothetical protein
MTTYWLYYHGDLLTAVRMKDNATDAEVIEHALHLHDIAPCVIGNSYTSPFEIERMIRAATIQRD